MSGGRKVILLLGVTAVMATAAALWLAAIDGKRATHMRVRRMPSPNAFDYYRSAVGTYKDRDTVGWAISSIPTPEPSELMSSHPITGSPPPLVRSVASAKAKEAVLRKNAARLARLREGFKYKFMNPPVSSRYSEALFVVQRYGAGPACLLVLESQVRSGKGDYSGAVQSCMDAFRLGNNMLNGGTIAHSVCAGRIHELARTELWRLMPHLDAANARRAALDLEAVLSKHVSYRNVLVEEKHAGQALLRELENDPEWHRALRDVPGYSKWAIPTADELVRAWDSLLHAHIAAAQRPWARPASIARPVVPPLVDAAFHMYGYTSEYDCVSGRFDWEYRCACDNLLLAALALRAYRLDHGTNPPTLADLVPHYLRAVPVDPFSGGAPVRYMPATGVVYSVGPDCVDGKAHPARRYPVDKSSIGVGSTGDIVPGAEYLRAYD